MLFSLQTGHLSTVAHGSQTHWCPHGAKHFVGGVSPQIQHISDNITSITNRNSSLHIGHRALLPFSIILSSDVYSRLQSTHKHLCPHGTKQYVCWIYNLFFAKNFITLKNYRISENICNFSKILQIGKVRLKSINIFFI